MDHTVQADDGDELHLHAQQVLADHVVVRLEVHNKAYPTYAKAAMQRRENLKHSADELKTQLEDAKLALQDAFEELKKVELLDERDQMRERAEEEAREQADLDAIGLMRSRGAGAALA